MSRKPIKLKPEDGTLIPVLFEEPQKEGEDGCDWAQRACAKCVVFNQGWLEDKYSICTRVSCFDNGTPTYFLLEKAKRVAQVKTAT